MVTHVSNAFRVIQEQLFRLERIRHQQKLQMDRISNDLSIYMIPGDDIAQRVLVIPNPEIFLIKFN